MYNLVDILYWFYENFSYIYLKEGGNLDITCIGLDSGVNEKMYYAKVTQNKDFELILDQVTGGKIGKEIQENYNITLDVNGIYNVEEFLNTNNIKCTNYVCISQETLSKMEQIPSLKKKVFDAIAEFSSPEGQAEIKALQPPVKSAGMIVYPDGKILYWLEGYPNDFKGKSEKNFVVKENELNDTIVRYDSMQDGLDSDEVSMMSILATGYKINNKIYF